MGKCGCTFLSRYVGDDILTQRQLNRLLVFVVVLSMICCNPVQIKIASDDGYIVFNLERTFVQDHADKPPTFLTETGNGGSGGGCGGGDCSGVGGDGEELLVAVVVVLIVILAAAGIERGVTNLRGTEVYVWPVGYGGYRQRIEWGANRIAIPAELKKKVFYLAVEMSGSYVGRTTVRIDREAHEVTIEEPTPTLEPEPVPETDVKFMDAESFKEFFKD